MSSDFAMQFALAARGWEMEPWQEPPPGAPRPARAGGRWTAAAAKVLEHFLFEILQLFGAFW